MPWFLLARAVFGLAVIYAAVDLRPLPTGGLPNGLFGGGLAASIMLLESRLRRTSLAHLVGALIGGAVGLLIARTIGPGLFWADSGDRRVAFLHSFLLLVLPYVGLVLGGLKG